MADITGTTLPSGTTASGGWGDVNAPRRYWVDTSTSNTSFSSGTTFTANGAHLVVPRIGQNDNNTDITISNSHIVYTNANPGFGNATQSTLNGNVTGTDWQLSNIVFVCTASAGGTGNPFAGFGVANDGGVLQGRLVNSIFGTDDTITWFINLQGVDANFEFANNSLTNAVLNTAGFGNLTHNIRFNGALRDHLNGRYTLRINGFAESNADRVTRYNTTNRRWTAVGECVFPNSTVSGQAYRTTPGTGNSQPSILQYSSNFQFTHTINGVANTVPSVFLFNNRYEPSVLSVQRSEVQSCIFREGYLWNPTFTDDVDGTTVDDRVLVSVPPNTFNWTLTAPTVNNVKQQLLDTFPTSATEGSYNADGYFIQVSSVNPNTRNRIAVIAKALDYSTDDTFTVASGNTHTPRAKSYTHRADNVTTKVSNTTYDGGNNGTFTYTNPDNYALPSDAANLNGRDRATAASLDSTQLTAIDDWYPVLKANWYGNNSLLNQFPVSIVGTTIVAQNDLTVSTTIPTSNINGATYDASVRSARTATGETSLTAGNITGAQVIGNHTLGLEGLALPTFTSTLGSSGVCNIPGTTCVGTFTMDGGNYTNVSITNNTFGGLNIQGSVFITLDQNAPIDITLEDAWGTVNLTGTVTIQNNGTGSVTLRTNAIPPSAASGANITIVPITTTPTVITVPTSTIAADTVWQVRDSVGQIIDNGIGPVANLVYTRTRMQLTTNADTGIFYFGSVRRNTETLWHKIVALPNAADNTGDSTQDVTLPVTPGNTIRDVPELSSTPWTGTPSVITTLVGTPANRIQLHIAGSILADTGDNILAYEQATASVARNVREDATYLTAIWNQIGADSNLTIPDNGSLAHDALLATSSGVDIRLNRMQITASDDQGIQVLPGARMVNDTQDFQVTTPAISPENQLRPDDVTRNAQEGNEPDVIFFPRIAERTVTTVDTQRILNAFGPLY